MTRYKPPALRILITDKDRSSDARLREYDPRVRTGPWWLDEASGIHYCNGRYTLEFMIEKEIRASEADSIDFVTHHGRFCCLDYACTESGMAASTASGIFSAGAVINGLNCIYLPISDDAYGQLRQELLSCYWQAKRNTIFTGSDTSPEREEALARAWASAWHFRRFDDRRTIESMFFSLDNFFGAVARLFESSFGAARLGIMPQQ